MLINLLVVRQENVLELFHLKHPLQHRKKMSQSYNETQSNSLLTYLLTTLQ